MADDFYSGIYNPDVLSCIANLSNDEVFTPPDVANAMLDLLPQELFASTETTFLDPACKSGVFLREIAKRLLAAHFPGYKEALDAINAKKSAGTVLTAAEETYLKEFQAGADHIFHHQLFGIAITELTSLLSRRGVYCSKFPNGEYSVSHFDDAEGNIRFKRIQHRWKDGKCVFCGASQSQYDRDESLETHAYEWIHTTKPEEILKMKFDVIISNPPYQLSDGGAQASASPLYDQFVNQSKKLKPRYMSMIIPARWFGGGKGLDSFRQEMISDTHIRVLHDFLNASDCFGNGVEIKGGVCYFLWSRDDEGKCKIYTHTDSGVVEQEERFMQEENSNVFIRYSEGVSVYHKVRALHEPTFEKYVSAQKPFGLRTYVHGGPSNFQGAVKLYERGGIGYIKRNEITKNEEWIDVPKVYISAAYNAGDTYPHQIIGKPIIGANNSCCTETYLVVGPWDNIRNCENVISYIQTKFFRFLVMLKKTSQHAAATVYSFVPMQDFSKPWSDDELYAKYGISKEEQDFIDSMIRPMDLNGGDDNA